MGLFGHLRRYEKIRKKTYIIYIKAYTENPQIVPNYQVKWSSVLQEQTLGEIIPKLAKDQMTEEEFVRRADESIQQCESEK